VNAGTLTYGVSNALSSGNLTANGGIINLGTYSDTVGTVTLTSGEINSSTGVLTGTSYAVASGSASAILAGAVNLTKTTAGTVTLSGTNTYTGITTVSGGTLSVSTIGNGGAGGSNLGNATNAASNIVFNTGTVTLQYTGSTASTDRSYTTTTGLTTQFDIINPSATLTWSGSGTATTAPINKIGPGTLKFSAAQNHTGLTSVLQGTLQYGVDNMLSTGALTVNNGTLDINNFSDSIAIITLANDGSIIDSGGSTAILTTTSAMTLQSGTISARIGGSMGSAFSKSTTDRVTLSGDNTFTSTSTSTTAGYIRLGHSNALGASGTSTSTTINSGAVMELVGNITIPATKTFAVSGSGINNVGVIRNISGTNTISANIPLGATNTRINSDAGSLTIPTVSGNTFNVLFGGAGDITVSGAISTTTGTLTKDGAGTLTLAGTNTYTGTTTISGGTIAASSTDSLGTGVSSNTLIFDGGTLKANGTITSPSARAITLTGNATFDTNDNSITLNGTVGSIGGLTKTGSGTLTLGNTTTVGGDLTISAGTLVAPTSLTLSGDFSNSGTYTHNNGTVLLTPADLSVSILGSSNTTFYNLTNNTANSTLTFKAGNTYTFANTLTINGTANNRITVNSDNPGSQWYMTLSGTASVSYLNVKDSGCSGGNSVGVNYTLVNNGNNGACWSFVLISGGSSGNIESSATPDPDQGGGGAGGGGGIEGTGDGDNQGGGGNGGGTVGDIG
jgi:autotransporter-associated beta strand protein